MTLGDLDEYLIVVGMDIVEFKALLKRLADDFVASDAEVKMKSKRAKPSSAGL